jgi:hypothetical protein
MTFRLTSVRLRTLAVGIAFAGSAFSRDHPADPSDITQSSYATPIRGDVIEWNALRPGETQAVEFEEGSAVLRASARAALAAALAHQASGVRAEVTGRPDLEGKSALGQARGLAIKRALLANGLAGDHIMMAEAPAGVIPDSSRQTSSTIRWIPPGARAAPARPMILPASAPPSELAAAASSSDAPVASPGASATQSWEVRTQDITLARTLERWASTAGYRLRWDADRNFLIAASDRYEGSFESALQAVLASAGIRQSDYPLEACVYANRPPLVRITRMGEQSRECEAP